MLASFKALKCQSGTEKKKNADEGEHAGVVIVPRSPKPNKPKLARRISRWKMESPVLGNDSQVDSSECQENGDRSLSTRTAVTTVNIEREDGTLGITLRGGMLPNSQLSKPVIITQLKPGGPAEKEGTIKPGDRLTAVNGVCLRGSTLEEAQALLKEMTPSTALTIEYDVKAVDNSLRSNGPLIIEIGRGQNEDLGLTLFQNEDGIFIEQIKRGSIADRCGALREGDKILAVNNRRIDVKPVLIESVFQLLDDCAEILHLEVLPARSMTISRSWRQRGMKKEDSGLSNPWYASGAVTHIEKLHTTLLRDSMGFGLLFADIQEGVVIIAGIQGNSPADRSGCLYQGDRILAVNHRSVALDMLTAQDATDLMESSPGGRLTLHTEFDVLETVVPASGIFNVRLIRRGVSGLGLTIAASKENEFVVCEVKKGSPAHRAGSLLPGDRLLAVNGTPLDQCSVEIIAEILQTGDEVITLKIERSEQSADLRCPRKVTCTVELQRYGGPIGITIAGSEEPCTPITVSGLTPGGLAEQTGALLVGDEILAINEHSLVGQPLSTAHALLHSSPDLVCLKISRSIVPNARATTNMSPLQSSSVDSAVESWGGSFLDLTLSPDQNKNVPPTGTIQRHPPNYNPKNSVDHSHLFDEITNENLNIQRELELLSQEINETARKTDQQPADSDYVQMQGQPSKKPSEETNANQPERESMVATDFENFEMSHLSDSRQWNCLNTSQPSIRSEFFAYNLLSIELKKDPVYEDFGFSVSDGLYERGVFINRIRKGGPADQSQFLQPYDRILQVNNTCTQDFDCCLTVPLIATAGDTLTLLVARPTSTEEVGIPYLGPPRETIQSEYSQYTARTMKRIVV